MEANRIETRLIQYGSQEYDAEVKLRDKILRKPLGLEFMAEMLANEIIDVHIGAFQDERLVGCLVLTKFNEAEQSVKMRQVAVEDNMQGKGVGKVLVECAEREARERGYHLMWCNARDIAIPFTRN